MSLPVVFRQIARQEMDESIAWYEKQQPGLGIQSVADVELALNRVAAAPEQFPQVRGEVRRALLRHFPYTIQFLAEAHRIVVLAVFHAKRNPKQLEDR